jgi:hypothetical protein
MFIKAMIKNGLETEALKAIVNGFVSLFTNNVHVICIKTGLKS